MKEIGEASFVIFIWMSPVDRLSCSYGHQHTFLYYDCLQLLVSGLNSCTPRFKRFQSCNVSQVFLFPQGTKGSRPKEGKDQWGAFDDHCYEACKRKSFDLDLCHHPGSRAWWLRAGISELWPTGQIWSSTYFYSLIGRGSCPFIYILSTTAFALHRQGWIGPPGTTWPAQSEVLSIWPFAEKVCWPSFKIMVLSVGTEFKSWFQPGQVNLFSPQFRYLLNGSNCTVSCVWVL